MEVQASADNSSLAATETTAPVETQASSQTEVSSQENPGAESPATSTAAPAEYKPTYKFKVKDQEKEFDEWIRPVIKDAETEKKVKDIYEKAFGLDEVKGSRDNYKSKYEEASTKFSNVEKSLTQLSKYVQKKDYNSFFETLQIPKEDIAKWIYDELKYNELPPEQRQAIDAQKNLARTQEEFEFQQQQYQSQVREFGQRQLQFELSKPEVSQIASQFDQRMGRPGAFEQEVINRGAYYENVHGKTLPAHELVKELIAFVNIGGQPAQPPVPQAQPTPSQSVEQIEQKPAIKVFSSGGNTSPVKKQVSSIADLKRIRNEMA